MEWIFEDVVKLLSKYIEEENWDMARKTAAFIAEGCQEMQEKRNARSDVHVAG
jgi:hypothetical protein